MLKGGGPDRIAKQHEQGKLTARERVDLLVDAGTFQEIGLFAQHRATHSSAWRARRCRPTAW
jgi:acetyl-CoA carboxylase carboxyltransferase component